MFVSLVFLLRLRTQRRAVSVNRVAVTQWNERCSSLFVSDVHCHKWSPLQAKHGSALIQQKQLLTPGSNDFQVKRYRSDSMKPLTRRPSAGEVFYDYINNQMFSRKI